MLEFDRSSFYDKIVRSPTLNTLDNILIRYSTSQNEGKLTVLKEFLTIAPNKLLLEEQKLQQALRILYHLNDNMLPLFKSFPNWRPEMPLTIDTKITPGSVCAAAFDDKKKLITFYKGSSPICLLGTMAHELKHAEQNSEELHKKVYYNSNHKEVQQLCFIREVHAKAFDTYVMMLAAKELDILDKLENEMEESPYFYGAIASVIREHRKVDPRLKDDIKLQENLMMALLPAVFHSTYKREYDQIWPINGDEKDITSIPESFHLSEDFVNSYILPELKKNAE